VRGNYDGYWKSDPPEDTLTTLKRRLTLKVSVTMPMAKSRYAITEMVDRGQYRSARNTFRSPVIERGMPCYSCGQFGPGTVYIGFHHCPLDLRIPFISSIRDTLRVVAS